jgi:hypothetical protein
LGYEPNELPDCSTPHIHGSLALLGRQTFGEKTVNYAVRWAPAGVTAPKRRSRR